MSMRFNTAAMIIEASTAFGVYLNSGVITNRVNNKTKDITMFDTAVLQPAI
jgi:cytochrome oxidase Cu insertion factor (SCO1/SenC/PrrC family)